MGEREIGSVNGMWTEETQFSVHLWGLVLRRLTTRELYCFDQKVYYTLPCNTLKVCAPHRCLYSEFSNPYSPQSVALSTYQYTIPCRLS